MVRNFRLPVLSFVVLLLICSLVSAADSTSTVVLIEEKGNATVRPGHEIKLTCKMNSTFSTRMHYCAWMFHDMDPHEGSNLVVHVTPPPDDTTRCILRLTNATLLHNGWWTCSGQSEADFNNNPTKIYKSEPIFLHVVTDEIQFEVAPINRTYSIGNTVDLECKTNVPVQSCQWSFQQDGQTEPLVVKEGPAVQDTDCSFQLRSISYEQVGQWWCGARVDEYENYTYTDTAYVQAEHKEEAFPIEFVEEPEDKEMHLGMTGELSCKVCMEAHIEDCRWYWQPVGRSRAWSILMREFLPVNGKDCTLQFSEVTSDMEGLWTCHVKPIHSSVFEISKSAVVTIRADVAVSVLTREVSVIEGEELVLRCYAEEMVGTCHWKRRDLYDANSSDSLTDTELIFPPKDKKSRDCSLSFRHAKKQHQGLWKCGMKVLDDEPFQYTLPTAVQIKLPKRVKFIEGSRTRLAADNKIFTLNCTALSAVEECFWLWYEDQTKMSEGVVMFNSTHDPGVYDCSVNIPSVNRSLQGIWQCAVKYTFNNHTNIVYATPFSLTVVTPEDIRFREVMPDVNGQLGPDGRVMLECMTWRSVEECVWLHQANKSADTREVARFEPDNFNNCSYLVEAGRSSGTWTCGARNPGDTNFTMAQSTTVALVQQGSVVTRTDTQSGSPSVLLQCQLLNTSSLPVSCHWTHPSGYNVLEFNETERDVDRSTAAMSSYSVVCYRVIAAVLNYFTKNKMRYSVESDPKKQICSVKFDSTLVDVGQWKCTFSCNDETHVLGQASITLLTQPKNIYLAHLVGGLSAGIIVLLVCGFISLYYHLQNVLRKPTAQIQPPSESKRYSEDPTTGINFSFTEAPELLVDFAIPTQDTSSHHYERVGHFLPSRSSFYQNVG